MSSPVSIYIHVPFCLKRHKAAAPDVCEAPRELRQRYLDALDREIEAGGDLIDGRELIEDGLHVKGPLTGIFKNIVLVALHQLDLQLVHGGKIAPTVVEALHHLGHAAHGDVRPKVAEKGIVQVVRQRGQLVARFPHRSQCAFAHPAAPAERLGSITLCIVSIGDYAAFCNVSIWQIATLC